jgi:meiotically up-regulated gene 157 (Mug157) protein
LRAILSLLRTEQWHFSKSKYFYKPLQGRFNEGIGLVWSFALPSDDQVLAGYNVPQNIMLVVALRRAAEMAKGPMRDAVLAAELEKMAGSVDEAVRRYGIVPAGSGDDMIYAFQVDGWGNSTTMDDANMPNLLWLPYLGYDDPAGLYEATRRFVLSGKNRNFFSTRPSLVDSGKKHASVSGLGSRHTSHGLRLGGKGRECHGHCVWHLGLIMQGMTATDEEERRTCMEEILSTSCKTDKLHEGFSPEDPCSYNRDGFGWANALFSDWVLREWAGLDARRAR